MPLILTIVLILLILALLPAWPYSRAWGPMPSGLISTLLLIVIILWALGTI